jgi:hypothetical protein
MKIHMLKEYPTKRGVVKTVCGLKARQYVRWLLRLCGHGDVATCGNCYRIYPGEAE